MTRNDTNNTNAAPRDAAFVYFVLVLAMWVLGLLNAFAHAKDAFSIFPEALWLSAISAALAFLASWVGFTGFRAEGWR